MSLRDQLYYRYRSACLFIGDHHKIFFAIALLLFALAIGWQGCIAFVVLVAVLSFIARQVPDNDSDWWDTHKGIGS